MKLQLKRSNVVNSNPVAPGVTASGLAKVPTQAQMKYGELAVNYCDDDPTIFMQKKDGSLVEPYFKKNSLQHLSTLP